MKAISARLRFEIFKRDGFRCRYCGTSASDPGVKLHCDHVLARAKGGDNDPENLVTSCRQCNLGKGPVSLDQHRLSRVLGDDLLKARRKTARLMLRIAPPPASSAPRPPSRKSGFDRIAEILCDALERADADDRALGGAS